MTRLLAAIVGVLCVLLAQPRVAGQNLLLSLVLDRAADYVASFERQLTGIVSEERYLQVIIGSRRELKSDLLLVPVAGEARYVEFRDVFEVDGRPVRDREDRLTRLFLDPSASASAQLRAIAEESARYNIGRIQRTVNIPTLALVFLRTENQAAVTFTLTNRTTPALMLGVPGFDGDNVTKAQSADFAAMPVGTRVVAFKEAKKNTLVRGAGNKDLPAEGRFWIDSTGAVVMSELTVNDLSITADIDVRYRLDPSVARMVPAEMRERYLSNFNGGPSVTGRATYDHFRTFQVNTSTDDVKPVK